MMDVEFEAMRALEKIRIFRANVIIALYVIVAIVTFGYAAATTASCSKVTRATLPSGTVVELKTEGECSTPQKAIVGVGAGIGWPLYWTWEVAEYFND